MRIRRCTRTQRSERSEERRVPRGHVLGRTCAADQHAAHRSWGGFSWIPEPGDGYDTPWPGATFDWLTCLDHPAWRAATRTATECPTTARRPTGVACETSQAEASSP